MSINETIAEVLRLDEEPDPCCRERLALCRAVLYALELEEIQS